jgi:SAM-dependent methyltransferase
MTISSLLRKLVPLGRQAVPWWRRINTEQKIMPDASSLPYPVSISAEPKYSPVAPADGGVESFDTPEAVSINRARLDTLASLQLPLNGKKVLDVGCGVGHLAQFFVKEQCEVLSVDARKENIERLKVLYPHLKGQVFNLEKDSFSNLGVFDIVFAFGALYHLENPFRALRDLCGACEELLLIETMVSDHYLPLNLMSEETASFNQAIHNIGSRPTPSFVILALRAAGFTHVYTPRVPPDHPDFRFDWRNDLCDSRDGHLLRCMFIASRQPIVNPHLISLLESS